ncbi:MAG: YceI family protein [Bacteroidota bacterium]
MKRFLYQLLIIATLFAGNAVAQTSTWVITNGCWLKVDGSTNINIFSCAIANYSKPDTIVINRNFTPVQLSGSMQLDVQNFDCHNPVMTADLRKTLKSKQFPRLIIRFQTLNNYPDHAHRQGIIKGYVTIELAGVSKRYEVDYKVVAAEATYINLEGSRKVNFSDFNLEPPRKLGGMIRTNNELSVVFNLRIKVI